MGISFYAYIVFTICSALTLLYFDRADTQLWLNEYAPELHKPVTDESADYSIQRTWALLFTATLLYIPANVYPIMNTNLLGNNEPSTIIGGVRVLWEAGSYPVASVIFIASVIVPVAKLITLSWLNYSVQSDEGKHQKRRALTYRITEFIDVGR